MPSNVLDQEFQFLDLQVIDRPKQNNLADRKEEQGPEHLQASLVFDRTSAERLEIIELEHPEVSGTRSQPLKEVPKGNEPRSSIRSVDHDLFQREYAD